ATPAHAAKATSRAMASPQPIFIVGLPRSGTTLLERMLGGHSQVQSAGELVDFDAQLRWVADMRTLGPDRFLARVADLDMHELGQRYLDHTHWRAQGKPFFIDKLPSNWQRIGLILAALPGARILHLVRDPLDVCFSNWRALLDASFAYSYDLPTLGAYCRMYRSVMAHWRAARSDAILDVPYADLVRNPEQTMRAVLDYCGLAWEPACAGVRGNTTPVMTPSAAQVRGGVHTRGFGQWRPYAGHLQPLIDALGDAMKARDVS
ncbi:MAG TPA: sulfotransferase, partial [Rhodanobacteraceae bacterium]